MPSLLINANNVPVKVTVYSVEKAKKKKDTTTEEQININVLASLLKLLSNTLFTIDML